MKSARTTAVYPDIIKKWDFACTLTIFHLTLDLSPIARLESSFHNKFSARRIVRTEHQFRKQCIGFETKTMASGLKPEPEPKN